MLTFEEVVEPNQYQAIRRHGAVVPFEPNKVAIAMMKAFMAIRNVCKYICSRGDFHSPLFSTRAIFKRGVLATASSIEQQLFALSKSVGATIKLQPAKANGFFSASKVNLRNAP